ncbi:hypothetical protein PG997_014072 [Apiospora hydei]|uniref:Uncharacterized protein n=1 Tax=Apiospora hydei TaxID=1337664 RepID=A0ABR1VAQ1_9PEZI
MSNTMADQTTGTPTVPEEEPTWWPVTPAGDNALGVKWWAQWGATLAIWSVWVPNLWSAVWGVAKRNLLANEKFRDWAAEWRLFDEEDFEKAEKSDKRVLAIHQKRATAAAAKEAENDDMPPPPENTPVPPASSSSSSSTAPPPPRAPLLCRPCRHAFARARPPPRAASRATATAPSPLAVAAARSASRPSSRRAPTRLV